MRSTEKYDFKKLIIRQFQYLLIPIVSWSLINLIRFIAGNLDNFSFSFLVKTYFLICLPDLWLLWGILFASVMVLLVRKFLNDNFIAALVPLIIFLFIPDVWNAGAVIFIYPYFMIGYYFAGKQSFTGKIKKYRFPAAIISIIIYVVLMMFFRRDILIYVSGYSIIQSKNVLMQILIDIYRYAVGLSGCTAVLSLIMIICSIKEWKHIKFIEYISKKSKECYIVSIILIKPIVVRVTAGLAGPSFLSVIIETILTFAATLIMIIIIEKIPIINFMAFGRKKQAFIRRET